MAKSLVERLVFGTHDDREACLAETFSDREVARAVIDLATLTRTLLDRLEAAGLVDRTQLRLAMAPSPPVTEGSYRGAPEPAPPPKVPTVRCTSCRADVPRARSFVHASGTLCGTCHDLEVAREERQERARRES